MIAHSMDEVLQQLDRLLARFREEHNKAGYFAGLYRIVVATFQEATRRGVFTHTETMKRLNAQFSNRYFEALSLYHRGEPPTQAWLRSLQAAQSSSPIVLQHLLMGINAHIHLDLGIAVVRACPVDELDALYPDFVRMNDVLGSLVEEIKQDLIRTWPALGLIEQWLGDLENHAFAFGLEQSREHAWQFAQELAHSTPTQQAEAIAQMDDWVAQVSDVIWRPPWALRAALQAARWGERGSVPEIIDLLAHKREPSYYLERCQFTSLSGRGRRRDTTRERTIFRDRFRRGSAQV